MAPMVRHRYTTPCHAHLVQGRLCIPWKDPLLHGRRRDAPLPTSALGKPVQEEVGAVRPR